MMQHCAPARWDVVRRTCGKTRQGRRRTRGIKLQREDSKLHDVTSMHDVISYLTSKRLQNELL